METITDSDYILDLDLPPFSTMSDANTAAKVAVELNQLAARSSDPIQSQKIKAVARAMWQCSLGTCAHVFRLRGAK